MLDIYIYIYRTARKHREKERKKYIHMSDLRDALICCWREL